MKTRAVAPPAHRAPMSAPAPRSIQPVPGSPVSGAAIHNFAHVSVSGPDSGGGPIQPMLRRAVSAVAQSGRRAVSGGLGGSGGGGKKPNIPVRSTHRDDTTVSNRERELQAAKMRRELSDHEASRLLHDRQAPRREKLAADLRSGTIDQEQHDAGLHNLRMDRWNTLTSFSGPIYAEEGKEGEVLRVTGTPGTLETPDSLPSGMFTTRESAGSTPEERRANLALPDKNNAQEERTAELTRDQTLLSGEVAPQGPIGTSGYNTTLATHLQPLPGGGFGRAPGGTPWATTYRPGGGQQLVTEGGRYTGAVRIGQQLGAPGKRQRKKVRAVAPDGRSAQMEKRKERMRAQLEARQKKRDDSSS